MSGGFRKRTFSLGGIGDSIIWFRDRVRSKFSIGSLVVRRGVIVFHNFSVDVVKRPALFIANCLGLKRVEFVAEIFSN